MKQTAVEWYFTELWNAPKDKFVWHSILEKAKEMEKEQISDTWIDSRIADKGDDYIGKQKSFEEYYQETYGKDA